MIFKSSFPKNKAQAYMDVFKQMLGDAFLQPEMAEKFHFAVVQTHGIRHAMGEPMSMLDSVAIGYRKEDGMLLSLFTPHSPWMSSTPDFAMAIANYRDGHQNRDNILKAFDLPDNAKLGLIGHMYEPIEKDLTDPQYMRDLMTTLMSRLFMEATLDELVVGSLPLAESPIMPLTEPQGRAINFEVAFRHGDGSSKNIMGLPVRDDFILTLSCDDKALIRRDEMSHNTRRGMGKSKVFFLEALGYIDFRLAAPAENTRPWQAQPVRYVPEFIVTAVRPVDEGQIADGSIAAPGLHDIQATTLAGMMASQFMRSGAWTKRFAEFLGSGLPMDYLHLAKDQADSVRTDVRGSQNELARLFNSTLAEGFMVSMDVDDNGLEEYTMQPLKVAVRDPHYLEKCFVPVMFHSFAAYNSFSQPKFMGDYRCDTRCHPVKRGGLHLDKGHYSRVSFGRLSMQRESDIRYIDALAAYSLAQKDRDQADRYMDAFYLNATMGYNSSYPVLDQNYKARRAFQQEQTDVTYTGVAERMTLEPQFLDEMHRLLHNNGGSMTVVTGEVRRPTVGHDSMTAF